MTLIKEIKKYFLERKYVKEYNKCKGYYVRTYSNPLSFARNIHQPLNKGIIFKGILEKTGMDSVENFIIIRDMQNWTHNVCNIRPVTKEELKKIENKEIIVKY